jgi:AraC family transcriptional activator of pobA
MPKKIPTYNICHLAGQDVCLTEIQVAPLGEFVRARLHLELAHRHDFFQIALFTHGSGYHSIDFQRYAVGPGHVYYLAPGQVHTWSFDAAVDGYVLSFTESFFGSFLHNRHFIREFPLFGALSGAPVNNLEAPAAAEVERTFADLLDEYAHQSPPAFYKSEVLRGLVIALLGRLARRAPSRVRESTGQHNATLVSRFEALIERDFRAKRLPRQYAEALFVTPNHLNALTTTLLGKSAGELIRDRVLLEAKRLLANSDLLVGQVADALNFEDYAYFTRFFKKYTGVTPEGFRAGLVAAHAAGAHP